MSEESKPVVNFGSLLLVLFIGLKLGHVIDWSWWWVFAPLWAPLAVVTIFFAGWFAGAVLHGLFREVWRKVARYRRKRRINHLREEAEKTKDVAMEVDRKLRGGDYYGNLR